jgi:hypothetical protein
MSYTSYTSYTIYTHLHFLFLKLIISNYYFILLTNKIYYKITIFINIKNNNKYIRFNYNLKSYNALPML